MSEESAFDYLTTDFIQCELCEKWIAIFDWWEHIGICKLLQEERLQTLLRKAAESVPSVFEKK